MILLRTKKNSRTQNEPMSEYILRCSERTRCSEHTASSTMYVMFCFDLHCSSWQKYFHFQRFLILLVPKNFLEGEGWRGDSIHSILPWKTWTPLKSSSSIKIFLLEIFWPALPFRYLDLCTLMTHISFLHWFSTPLLLFWQTALSSFILKIKQRPLYQSLPLFSLPFQQLLHFLAKDTVLFRNRIFQIFLLHCSLS